MCVDDNTVALTFDDGPHENTERLLDDLEALGADVAASFFLMGQQVGVLYCTVLHQPVSVCMRPRPGGAESGSALARRLS